MGGVSTNDEISPTKAIVIFCADSLPRPCASKELIYIYREREREGARERERERERKREREEERVSERERECV